MPSTVKLVKRAWKFVTAHNVNCSAAGHGGVVYFGSYDGYFYALEASSGNMRWKFQAGKRIHSSPAIVNGIIYFGRSGWKTVRARYLRR